MEKHSSNRQKTEQKEWKIDTWWKKTLLVAAMIQGFIGIIAFIFGFIAGFV